MDKSDPSNPCNDLLSTRSESGLKDGNNSIVTTASTAAKGRILLVIVAILYGTHFVSTRFIYEVPGVAPTAAALSATRGWLNFVCFLPPWILDSKRTQWNVEVGTTYQPQWSFMLFRSGLELAVWNVLCSGLEFAGLVSTEAARGCFLAQMGVLFTPLLSVAFLGAQSVTKTTWFATMVALTGLLVLAIGSSDETSLALSLSKGDLMLIGSALSWSIYVFRLENLGPKHPELFLQGVKSGLMAVLYSSWWLASTAINSPGGLSLSTFSSFPSWMTSGYVIWVALFYAALGPGMIAGILQQKGQKTIRSSEANILLSSDSVFAAIFAFLLLGEKPSLLELLGGALILVATMIVSLSEGAELLQQRGNARNKMNKIGISSLFADLLFSNILLSSRI